MACYSKLVMRLFVYDHCHYCVHARVVFGLKWLPLKLEVFSNNDEASPIAMIGAKLCLAHDLLRHPETRILRWFGYKIPHELLTR